MSLYRVKSKEHLIAWKNWKWAGMQEKRIKEILKTSLDKLWNKQESKENKIPLLRLDNKNHRLHSPPYLHLKLRSKQEHNNRSYLIQFSEQPVKKGVPLKLSPDNISQSRYKTHYIFSLKGYFTFHN